MALGTASQHVRLVGRVEKRIKGVTGGNMLAALAHGNGREDKILQEPNHQSVEFNGSERDRTSRRERNHVQAVGEGVSSKGICVVQESGKKR